MLKMSSYNVKSGDRLTSLSDIPSWYHPERYEREVVDEREVVVLR
jgi:hypothetical protein